MQNDHTKDMTHEEKTKSGMALQACVDAFSGQRKLPLELEAQFYHHAQPGYLGSVYCTISKRSINDYPVLDCDDTIMRSFGVSFGNFDPEYQQFSFDEKNRELRISHSDYDFVLAAIKLRTSR